MGNGNDVKVEYKIVGEDEWKIVYKRTYIFSTLETLDVYFYKKRPAKKWWQSEWEWITDFTHFWDNKENLNMRVDKCLVGYYRNLNKHLELEKFFKNV